MISVNAFCASHQLKLSFVESLQHEGLITITTVEETVYVDDNELSKLEYYARLYHDLEINLEGIEAITHLLGQIDPMHQEINRLKNRLSLYEGD